MRKLNQPNLNTKEHWSEIYKKCGPNITRLQQFRYELMVLNIPNIEGELIDLGCGTGTCDVIIRQIRPGLSITGVDIIDPGEVLRVFKQYIMGDVANTHLPKESFDFVLSCEVLEHLEEPQKLINEMHRLLKPGGRALLTTPLDNILPSEEHVWEFDIYDVNKMFKKAGFDRFWVFPFSSGNTGDWDQIFAFAKKI